jgi:hypothetical protein
MSTSEAIKTIKNIEKHGLVDDLLLLDMMRNDYYKSDMDVAAFRERYSDQPELCEAIITLSHPCSQG